MRRVIRAALLVVAIAPGGAGSQPRPPVSPYQSRPAPSPWGPVRSGAAQGPGLPWSWLSVEEVRPDGGQESREELLAWLVAPEDAQRAEALIRLLPSADELLPGLETLARTGDEAERARLLESLQVLTRRRLRLERLEAWPHLSALVAGPVARGRELVAPWVEVTETDELVEEFRDQQCGTGQPPGGNLLIQGARLQRLRDELWTLGGLALPAIEQLLSSPSAPVRLHGIVLVRLLGLHPDSATLARLQRDRTEVELPTRRIEGFRAPPVGHGRWKVPMAQHADSLVRALTPQVVRRASRTPPVSVDIENRIIEWSSGVQRIGESEAAHQRRALFLGIASALRGAGGWQARDEQEYWNRVRPLWRTWWRVLGPGAGVDDRMLWSNLGTGYVGLQSVSEPRDDKQYVLRLAGPAGAEVELLSLNPRNETLAVRRGVLPLELRAAPGTHSIKVHLGAADAGLELAWRMVRPGESETVWLNPELRRRHLEALKEAP